MRIHANRHSPALTVLVLASLAACSGETHPGTDTPDVARGSEVENCLLLVWENQEDPDQLFDRANDTVEGGAISCATGTSATEYANAIDAIRAAAKSGDRAAMLDAVGIPLLYVDAEGKRRELNDPAMIDAVFDDMFDAEMLALMGKLDLSQMAVENRAGGYFGLGALWLAPEGPGQRPRIRTINRQALQEALSAGEAPALSTDS